MTTIILLLIAIAATWCCAWCCCLRAVRRVLDEHIEVARRCDDQALVRALGRIRWTITRAD